MDEATEELASLYVLGLLETEEAMRFRARLAEDDELRHLVSRLEMAAAAVGRAVPPRDPPPAVKARVLAQIRPETVTPAQVPGSGLPWAMAASIVILAGGWLYWHGEKESKALEVQIQARESELMSAKSREAGLQAKLTEQDLAETAIKEAKDTLLGQLQSEQKENVNLRAQLDSTQHEVASLQAGNVLSQIKIATLTSLLHNSPKAMAVVAWDPDQQRGLLKTINLPATAPDKDYQLWIVDPAYKNPVSGGVFEPDGQASSSQFKPGQPITKATKFAVSLERKGGVPVAQGPMVLISE